MKIGLFIKYENVDSNFEKKMIEKIKGFSFEFDNKNPDYVLVFGGDGTFLKATHHYLDQLDKVKFICVNKGKLGFFSSFVEEEVDEVLSDINGDKYVINNYRLVSAEMNGEKLFAVNEIRIESPFHTLTSEVYIDDEFLELFKGNGLVVSSASGSSAYNKSLGGALIDTRLETLQMKEIAPLNNRIFASLNSSIVLPGTSKIVFRGDFTNVVIGYDHLVKKDYQSNEITLTLSDKKVSLLAKKKVNYIKKVNYSFIERK